MNPHGTSPSVFRETSTPPHAAALPSGLRGSREQQRREGRLFSIGASMNCASTPPAVTERLLDASIQLRPEVLHLSQQSALADAAACVTLMLQEMVTVGKAAPAKLPHMAETPFFKNSLHIVETYPLRAQPDEKNVVDAVRSFMGNVKAVLQLAKEGMTTKVSELEARVQETFSAGISLSAAVGR